MAKDSDFCVPVNIRFIARNWDSYAWSDINGQVLNIIFIF